MLFTGIILKAVQHIQQERSVFSIYYLITGSKNIQTKQDAQLFSNQAFYGIYKGLTKSAFDAKIKELIHHGFLRAMHDEKERKVVISTKKGKDWLEKHQDKLSIHSFEGMAYEGKAPLFYSRLLLLIQTLSNIRENNFTFIPVITNKDAERFVRTSYRKIKGNEMKFIQELYDELEYVLKGVSEEEASIFVDRLSGFHYYGKSVDQLGVDYDKDLHDVRLIIIGVVHHFLSLIELDKGTLPILSKLIKDLEKPLNLTASAEKTYKLFKKGISSEQIARIRRLKINTIYDHLTEIALHDEDFPFEQFVPEKAAKEILEVIKNTKTFKLKEIKEQIHSTISFFQIRLMLVYHQKEKEADSFV